MTFEDKTIICADCGEPFEHTVEDQERYASRGFTNDPKRCRACREKRKSIEEDGEARTLVCEDCQSEFTFSARDQAYYAERGFSHEPKRCPDCREKRRQKSQQRRRQGGGGGGRGGQRGGGGGRDMRRGRQGPQRGFRGGGESRGPRENFEVVCSACGVKTTVPFKPVSGRPVYCRDCFRSRKR